MQWLKTFLKNLILKTCSPALQQRLRRFYLAERIIRNQGLPEPEIRILRSLVYEGDSVADIGACIGVYTREFSSLVGDSGHVYSFEPVPQNFEILQDVVRKAHLSNVQLFRMALGSAVGQRDMNIPDLGGFAGYYWAHVTQPGDSGRCILVDVSTIAELYRSSTFSRLDFIKCDVEGSELEVIQGGSELIQSQLPGWLVEVSRKTSFQVFRFFHELGYRAFVYRGQLLETRSYRDHEFSNYFFFHPDSKVWERTLSCRRQSSGTARVPP